MGSRAYTATYLKRDEQLGKIRTYWEKAADAYIRFGLRPDTRLTTKWLKTLRDYLNREFPEKRRKNEGLG